MAKGGSLCECSVRDAGFENLAIRFKTDDASNYD
jgi:hypothetical protein